MKRINFFVALSISMMLLTLIACEKESSLDKFNEPSEVVSSGTSLEKGRFDKCAIDDIAKSGDKLIFKDMDHFVATVECLEYNLEEHNAAFENQYTHLNDDDYNNLAESVGFMDYQTLEEFEEALNFSSRRAFIEDKIQAWMDNDVLDLENDPDDLDDLTEELRTLLSVKGEVVIDGKIINFLSREDDEKRDCRFYDRDREWFRFDNNLKKYKLKVVEMSLPFMIKAKAKVKVLQQKSGRGWKRYRTNLYVTVSAQVRDYDCNFPQSFGATNGIQRRASLKAKRTYWSPPTLAKYESGEGVGSCQLPDYNQIASLILAW